jgi:CSLREA domain-containing protein
MRIPKLSAYLPLLILFVTAAAVSVWPQQAAALYTVDSNADTHDAVPGDRFCADAANRCTLRAAIEEANAEPASRDVIVFNLSYPSVIDLTIGEIAITGNVSIVGPGARRVTVKRSQGASTPDFRVFHVSAGLTLVSFRGMKIMNGRSPADTSGGGILIDKVSSVSLNDLWIEDNIAGTNSGSGGGVFNSGNLKISRCLFLNNRGYISGSALYNASGSSATVLNSTFSRNGGLAQGAIFNQSGGTLSLVNDTFFKNDSAGGPSDVANFGTTNVLNTFFADAFSANFTLLGAFNSLGNNVVVLPGQSTGFVDGVNGDQVGNIADPHVAADLADNGGQTDTLALLPGSPAIGHGNSCVLIGGGSGNCSGLPPGTILLTDQRAGFSRPFNTLDVGAYDTGAQPIGGNPFFSFSITYPGVEAKTLGSIGVLTDAVTNQKLYTVSNGTGHWNFKNVGLNVLVFEIKSKRQGLSLGPFVNSFDDFSRSLALAPQTISLGQGITLTRTLITDR